MSDISPPQAQSVPRQETSSRIGQIVTITLLGIAAYGIYRLYEERQKRNKGGGGGGLCGGGGGGGGGCSRTGQSLGSGLAWVFRTPVASRFLGSSFTPAEDID